MSFAKKTWMLLCLLSFVGFSVACGTPNKDGSVLAINPSIVRVGVNEVTTIQVFLTKPRENEGTLSFFIDDNTVIGPASTKGEVPVSKGQDMISFDVQGFKAGRTTIKAKLDGNIIVTVPVIVSGQ